MVLIGRNMAPDQICLAQPRYPGRVYYYGEIVGNLSSIILEKYDWA